MVQGLCRCTRPCSRAMSRCGAGPLGDRRRPGRFRADRCSGLGSRFPLLAVSDRHLVRRFLVRGDWCRGQRAGGCGAARLPGRGACRSRGARVLGRSLDQGCRRRLRRRSLWWRLRPLPGGRGRVRAGCRLRDGGRRRREHHRHRAVRRRSGWRHAMRRDGQEHGQHDAVQRGRAQEPGQPKAAACSRSGWPGSCARGGRLARRHGREAGAPACGLPLMSCGIAARWRTAHACSRKPLDIAQGMVLYNISFLRSPGQGGLLLGHGGEDDGAPLRNVILWLFWHPRPGRFGLGCRPGAGTSRRHAAPLDRRCRPCGAPGHGRVRHSGRAGHDAA